MTRPSALARRTLADLAARLVTPADPERWPVRRVVDGEGHELVLSCGHRVRSVEGGRPHSLVTRFNDANPVGTLASYRGDDGADDGAIVWARTTTLARWQADVPVVELETAGRRDQYTVAISRLRIAPRTMLCRDCGSGR